MPSLIEQARQAAREALALFDAAVEHGDLAEAIAAAVLDGHTLFLLADPSHAALAEGLADALRRHFTSDLWPPVLTLTADVRPLALIGCAYGGNNPLSQQAEELVRRGDVVLALSGAQPSNDLIGAVGTAVSQGAVVLALGPAFAKFPSQASVTLPSGAGILPADSLRAGGTPAPRDAAPERVVECQLVLGHALAEGLARRLPAAPPSGSQPALLRSACANCDAPLTVPRHLAGRHGVCPHCFNNTVLAPESAGSEKRVHMRFALLDCSLAVTLTPLGKPPLRVPGQISLENISLGGLLFAMAGSPLELQPGDLLALELSTPAFLSPLPLAGSVIRVTREATVHRVGVLFGDLPPAVAERLRLLERNLVLRHLAARPPRPENA